ncbi:hypothetical protein, partial [Endozoicomonas sp. ALC013]
SQSNDNQLRFYYKFPVSARISEPGGVSATETFKIESRFYLRELYKKAADLAHIQGTAAFCYHPDSYL